MQLIVRILLLGMFVVATGCDQQQSSDHTEASTATEQVTAMQQVTGTVNFRERLRLAPDTVVEVSLLDVSRADAAAVEIARQVITSPGNPPIAFTLNYPADSIDPRMSYVVRAVIKRGDRLQMTTDQAYPVLTRGAPDHVELMLRSLPATNTSPTDAGTEDQ